MSTEVSSYDVGSDVGIVSDMIALEEVTQLSSSPSEQVILLSPTMFPEEDSELDQIWHDDTISNTMDDLKCAINSTDLPSTGTTLTNFGPDVETLLSIMEKNVLPLPETTMPPPCQDGNNLYSFVLPSDSQWLIKSEVDEIRFNSDVTLPSLGSVPAINGDENYASCNYFVLPCSAASTTMGDSSLDTSGISMDTDRSSESQSSHDTNFSSLDPTEGCDESLNTGVTLASNIECVDHEETIDCGYTSAIFNKFQQNIEYCESNFISRNDEPNQHPVIEDSTHEYIIQPVFANQDVTLVFDDVDGVGTQQVLLEEDDLNCVTFSQQEHQESNVDSYHQQPNHERVVKCGDSVDEDTTWAFSNDCNPPEEQRSRRGKHSSKRRLKTNAATARKFKKSISHSETNTTGEGTKICGTNIEETMTVSQSTHVQKSRGSGRPRNEAFRLKMGPHLRTLSAVLEITGIKNASDFVPYEIIRRFHPTQMNRAIEKSIQFMEEWKIEDAKDLEPNWHRLDGHCLSPFYVESEEELPHKGDCARVYYSTPFGYNDHGPHCIVSFRKEFEENGQLKCFPDTLTGVGTAELNTTLDLHTIAGKCINTEYKDAGYGVNEDPLLMRLREPKCTSLLYKSGKLIVVGAKSYDQFRIAVRRFARQIQKTGVDVKLTQLKLQFFIGMVKLPFGVNVKAMMHHEYLAKFILYDPKAFPGVIIQINDSPILCLVFDTGAILFMAAAGEGEMKDALAKIYPTLRLFAYQR